MNSQRFETLHVCECGYTGTRRGHADAEGRVCPSWSKMREFVPVERNAWLEGALRAIDGPEDRGPFIDAYRAAGGGYEGLQAIARLGLGGSK